jgi:FemAB-related protein (PEP-CTERM system-associated)
VEGVLPLAELKSRLFGHRLISVPFCVYGGPLSNGDETEHLLLEAACALARELNVDDLEVRARRPQTDWPIDDLYFTFRKEISGDAQENMRAIPRKQRAMVRKGIAANLESTVDAGVDSFYRIYSQSVRNLGTPVFSKRYFEVLSEVFTDECELLMVRHEDVDIGAVMSFYFRDEVLPYYGGSLPAARAVKGNDFMYWELMSRAATRGVRIFDFGRSKRGTGPFNFKKNWGFDPELLHYQHYLVRASRIPQVNPANPRYQAMIKAWRHLPLPIANRIGPAIARNLG